MTDIRSVKRHEMKIEQKKNRPVLKLDNVCKNFGGIVAADNITLEVFPGEIFGLIGPNGAGKTTLLNLINGLLEPDCGSVYLEDRNMSKFPVHKRAKLGIARTFQHPRLLGRCDINTNLLVGIDLAVKRNVTTMAESKSLMNHLLEVAGFGDVELKDSIEKLSYGKQKLLEIIRAMLTTPVLMLVDERQPD